MAYRIVLSNHFRKDAKKLSKKQIDKTKAVIQMIADGEVLPDKYCDHQLKGELKEYRDCHVEPDLVLIYKLEDDILTLTAFRVAVTVICFDFSRFVMYNIIELLIENVK